MSHYVVDGCISCKYTDCVTVCPVDCFHEGPNFLVIDPEECIDCALCVTECPVNAIKNEGDLIPSEIQFIQINSQFSKTWPIIASKKEPLDGAEDFKSVKNKISSIGIKT